MSGGRSAASLTVAAGVVAIEGITVLGLGGYAVVHTVIGAPVDVMSSIIVAVAGIAVGAGLLWVARGLHTAQRWSRTPGVVTQIFLIPIAVTFLQSGRPAMGVPLIVAALVALAALLAPPTTKALYGDE